MFISHISDACETCFLCEMKQKIFSQLLYLWLVVNKTKSVTFPTTTTSSFMAYDIPFFSFSLSLSLFHAVFSFYSSYPLLLEVINSLVSVLSFFFRFLAPLLTFDYVPSSCPFASSPSSIFCSHYSFLFSSDFKSLSIFFFVAPFPSPPVFLLLPLSHNVLALSVALSGSEVLVTLKFILL